MQAPFTSMPQVTLCPALSPLLSMRTALWTPLLTPRPPCPSRSVSPLPSPNFISFVTTYTGGYQRTWVWWPVLPYLLGGISHSPNECNKKSSIRQIVPELKWQGRHESAANLMGMYMQRAGNTVTRAQSLQDSACSQGWVCSSLVINMGKLSFCASSFSYFLLLLESFPRLSWATPFSHDVTRATKEEAPLVLPIAVCPKEIIRWVVCVLLKSLLATFKVNVISFNNKFKLGLASQVCNPST